MHWSLRIFVLSKELLEWHALYISEKVDTMSSYDGNLYSELEPDLHHRNILTEFLDLGAGPATQSIWLVKGGFNVMCSDLSEDAIKRARNVYANEKNANFVADDNSKFQPQRESI